jgi:hypothetical protein
MTKESNNNWEVVNGSASTSERVPFVEPSAPAPEPKAEDRKEQHTNASNSDSMYTYHDIEEIVTSAASMPQEQEKEKEKETEPNGEDASDDDEILSEVNLGASVAAGAVSGLLLGGPILSIIGAAGAGMYAKENGVVGDVVRAGGEVAISVGERASRLNKKHGCVSKAKQAAGAAGRKICEVGREQKVWGKVKSSAQSVGSKAIEIENEHHLLENLLALMSKGFASLAERVNPPGDDTKSGSVPPPVATANDLPVDKNPGLV